MKKLFIPILLMLLALMSGCTNKNTPRVRITLDDDRVINLVLYREIAPDSVANFLDLVDQKFYDGVIFHRIIEGFVVQAGGYSLDDNAVVPKPETKTIKGEFSENDFENNLKHTLGVISMARSQDYDSASNQFFICTADAPSLDGKYAAFGKTIDEESNEVLLDLEKVATYVLGYGFEDFPVTPIKIKTIRRI